MTDEVVRMSADDIFKLAARFGSKQKSDCAHAQSRPVFYDLCPAINRQCKDCGLLFVGDQTQEGRRTE